MISFNEVPSNLRAPLVAVEFNGANAQQGPGVQPYRILVVGQRDNATATQDALVPVRVTSAAQAANLHGTRSMLAAMAASCLTAHDGIIETWSVGLDEDDEGTAATGSISIGGSVSAGTIGLMIAGTRIRIGISTGQTTAQIATAVAAAINAASLPVSAVVDGVETSQVNLTCRWKGETGNDIDIRHSYYEDETLPAGLTITTVAMAGGTASPDVAALWAALGDEHYNILVWPYTDSANLTALEEELTDRAGPLRMIDAMAFIAKTDSHGTVGSFGDGRNSPYLSCMATNTSPTPPWVWAGAVAGVAARYGSIDPARPFQTLSLPGILPPPRQARWTYQERNLLLFDGISTFTVDAGGVVRVERLVTMYQTNAADAPDTAFLDVNTPLTLSYLRWDFRAYWGRKYPRHKLAGDGNNFGAGQAVMTPKLAKAECLVKFRQWEELGLVEDVDQFKRDLLVEINASDPNRLDVLLPPNLVNQLRVTGVQIAFLL